MDTSNIIFCTNFTGEEYCKLAIPLIESFLRNTKNSKLLALTDNVEYFSKYREYENIIFERMPEHFFRDDLKERYPGNICYLAIKKAWENAGNANVICYLVVDSIIDFELTNEHFADLKFGFNPNLWDFTELKVRQKYDYDAFGKMFPNMEITRKMERLIRNKDEVNFYEFKEQCLIFSDIHNPVFETFINEWENIYFEIERLKEGHTGLCFDINLAVNRSNLPINNIYDCKYYFHLVDAIKTLNYTHDYAMQCLN
jgi:hypothetical protein